VSDAGIRVLNYALLGLLYLFFGRVMWVVWSEVKGPRKGTSAQARAAAAGQITAPTVPPTEGVVDATQAGATPSRGKGHGGSRRRERSAPTQLVVLEPRERKGATFPIGREVILGRAASAGISLELDTYASQLHARVFATESGVFVEDLGSTNGSVLNGVRLTAPQPLQTGDRLQVGQTLFEAQ
jgi:hypothetical protein